MNENSDFMKRFLKLFKLLGSDHAGERESAASAIYRLCDTTGVKITDIAIMLAATEADANKIFARGVERGRNEAGGHSLSADYFDGDGQPRWDEMVKFCMASPGFGYLKQNEQEFISEVQVKLQFRAPTRPMGGCLLSIYWKLGGEFK
jgi:hypothetical protein